MASYEALSFGYGVFEGICFAKKLLIERGSIESLEVGEDWGPFCGVAVCTLCTILPCERAVPAYATEFFFMGVARQGDMQCKVPERDCINGGRGT